MAAAKNARLTRRQIELISRAVADPRRYGIMQKLGKAPRCACWDMKKGLTISKATLSHHLKELENAGLVEVEREGKYAFLSLRRDVWKSYLEHLSRI